MVCQEKDDIGLLFALETSINEHHISFLPYLIWRQGVQRRAFLTDILHSSNDRPEQGAELYDVSYLHFPQQLLNVYGVGRGAWRVFT